MLQDQKVETVSKLQVPISSFLAPARKNRFQQSRNLKIFGRGTSQTLNRTIISFCRHHYILNMKTLSDRFFDWHFIFLIRIFYSNCHFWPPKMRILVHNDNDFGGERTDIQKTIWQNGDTKFVKNLQKTVCIYFQNSMWYPRRYVSNLSNFLVLSKMHSNIFYIK